MAYAFTKVITIDKTKVPNTDQINFTVTVSGTFAGAGGDPDLRAVGSGGAVQNANGYDVAFFSDSALTTQLPHETGRWIGTTGEVVYWVKLPTVSTSVNTRFYLAYGDSGITTDQSDPTNAWDSFRKIMLHLGDGTTLSGSDSTANGHNGTLTGGIAASVAGIAGGALLDGSNDQVDFGDHVDFTQPTGFTASVRTFIPGGFGLQNAGLLAKYSGTGSGTGSEFVLGILSGGIYGFVFDNSLGGYRGRFGPGHAVDAYFRTTMVYDGGTSNSSVKVYVDGVQIDTSDFGGGSFSAIRDTSRNMAMGSYNDGTGGPFKGQLDELFFDATPRSADWLLTLHNNESSPTTFFAVATPDREGQIFPPPS